MDTCSLVFLGLFWISQKLRYRWCRGWKISAGSGLRMDRDGETL